MKKIKQILAILGIIALVAMYVLTIFAAIFDPTATLSYLAAAVAATILIPAILWILGMFLRITGKNGFDDRSDAGQEQKDKDSDN